MAAEAGPPPMAPLALLARPGQVARGVAAAPREPPPPPLALAPARALAADRWGFAASWTPRGARAGGCSRRASPAPRALAGAQRRRYAPIGAAAGVLAALAGGRRSRRTRTRRRVGTVRDPQNVWRLLGLNATASKAEIKQNFKVFVRKNHPDVKANSTPRETQRFYQIMGAYRAIMDSDEDRFWLESYCARVAELNKRQEDAWARRSAELRKQAMLDAYEEYKSAKEKGIQAGIMAEADLAAVAAKERAAEEGVEADGGEAAAQTSTVALMSPIGALVVGVGVGGAFISVALTAIALSGGA